MAMRKIRAYILTLDNLGDLHAEEGSVRWARAVRYQLQTLARDSKAKLRRFRDYLRLMAETQGYQQLEAEDGQPFPSLAAFAMAKIPYGLGYDPDVILHIQEEIRAMLLGEKVAEVQKLLGHGGDRRSGEFGQSALRADAKRGSSGSFPTAPDQG
jgi:hypothetical protein